VEFAKFEFEWPVVVGTSGNSVLPKLLHDLMGIFYCPTHGSISARANFARSHVFWRTPNCNLGRPTPCRSSNFLRASSTLDIAPPMIESTFAAPHPLRESAEKGQHGVSFEPSTISVASKRKLIGQPTSWNSACAAYHRQCPPCRCQPPRPLAHPPCTQIAPNESRRSDHRGMRGFRRNCRDHRLGEEQRVVHPGP